MTRTRELAIWVLVAAMAAAAGTVHWFAVVPHGHADQHWSLVAAVLVAVGFLLSEVNTVHIRLGREAYAFSLMEFPLVLGLFFVRPDLLVLCRLAGAVLAFAWERRPLQKALFNASLFALETSVAVAVWHAVAEPQHELDPLAWAATTVAVLVTSLLGSAAVTTVITIATGERPSSLSEVFSIGQVGDLANACFALVAVYVLMADWRAGWLLGVVVAVIVVAYRSSERARARSESLIQVNHFTEVVGRERELDDVVGTVLREVRDAFEVAVVQLRFAEPDGTVHDWVLDGDAPESRTATLVDAAPRGQAETPVLLPRRLAALGRSRVLPDQAVRDLLQVPLRFEGGAVGSLVVAEMLGDVETFAPADIGRLQALGNHASVAIENALAARTIARQAAEREHQALHDELTGLPNRRLFGTRVEEALAVDVAAVLLLDLDRFKDVNDTLGHETGDRLLALVADRLGNVLSASVVARFGGDEFALLLSGAADDAARSSAALVRDALTRPFDLDGIAVAVDASVGVAVGEQGGDAVSLLRAVDVAMYAAKQSRSGIELFRPELDRGDSSRLGLLADLRATVASAGIDVWFQPKVDVRTGALTGVEALARWPHPQLGHVSPDEFIPLAEHSSLITPLTMHVLRRALDACQQWRRTSPDFTVAVNISPRSLLDDAFVDDVARELARVAVPAAGLTLEITETSLMTDPERAISALGRLRDLGVRLSVDDLGTGYSSLAYLQRLPVDEVKIDRTFLRDLDDPSSVAVVGAVVDLGHRLGRHVVAEGVEDEAAFDRLRELGCDSAQGYWLARPMPLQAMSELLAAWVPPRGPVLRSVEAV